MKISGVLPLRNGVKFGYPFELAIRSLRQLCDEVVVLVDPTSEDESLARVRAHAPDVLVESVWDMTNHDGHRSGEIARQTAIALGRASGDWVLSLQADEVLHEGEVGVVKEEVDRAGRQGVTALDMIRWYFFGSLTKYRDNWTVPLPRLFKRGCWHPDPQSGAMYFLPASDLERRAPSGAGIYHYSRVGDPVVIARRVRNLDGFYHPPQRLVPEVEVTPYTFDLRRLDTYVDGHKDEPDEAARLLPFPLDKHPAAVLEFFGAT